jgi:hypothetical protein
MPIWRGALLCVAPIVREPLPAAPCSARAAAGAVDDRRLLVSRGIHLSTGLPISGELAEGADHLTNPDQSVVATRTDASLGSQGDAAELVVSAAQYGLGELRRLCGWAQQAARRLYAVDLPRPSVLIHGSEAHWRERGGGRATSRGHGAAQRHPLCRGCKANRFSRCCSEWRCSLHRTASEASGRRP